jgi:hypothetical protein
VQILNSKSIRLQQPKQAYAATPHKTKHKQDWNDLSAREEQKHIAEAL